jgi:transposase
MKQYEAVRAFVVDNKPVSEIAELFNYSIATVYTLIKKAKSGVLELFPEITSGAKRRHTSDDIQKKIIDYRNADLSIFDIQTKLKKDKINISVMTIDRILREIGFSKLPRRTNKERGVTKNGSIIPLKSIPLNLSDKDKFSYHCPTAALYCFIPYIIELGLIDIVKECRLPKSSAIGNIEAALSFLILKLLGAQRLSHMDSYNQMPGLGLFANLNVLPKNTYMNTYSTMTSDKQLLDFQKKLLIQFRLKAPKLFCNKYINLDFHSIAHYGDGESLEKVWCGAKGKTLKGANTLLVQDSDSSIILYTKADVLRKDECGEILNFVDYWKSVAGDITETLVFDCKLTKYEVLGKLQKQNINFITLRKRNKNLITETLLIPQKKWTPIHLPIPKRKYKNFYFHECKIKLKGCDKSIRQIIMKEHGRIEPTFIITNNHTLKCEKIIEVYAKRWHIENKISELVSFFNLNALNSPLMVRIHFDMIWTMIADTLYRRLALDLSRFEKCKAGTIFKKFINIPGKISYDGSMITVTMRKHAHTPIWLSVQKITKPFEIPWLNNIKMQIKWVM